MEPVLAATERRAERRAWTAIAAICLSAYVLRFAFILQLHGTPFFGALAGEALFFDHWARAIGSGQWLGLSSVYPAPPFAMYYLGAIYTLAGHDLAVVRLLGCVVDAANCLLIFLIGSRLFGRRAGLASAALWAIYVPALFFEAVMPGTAAIILLLLCGLLALIAGAPRGRGLVAWFGAGLCLALASLGRPHLLIMAPVFAGWIASRAGWRRGWPKRLALGLVPLLLGLAVVLALPPLRNLAVTGQAEFSANLGPGFYVGNYPDDPARVVARIRGSVGGADIEEYTAYASVLAGRPLNAREANAFWIRRTLDHITSEPVAFARTLGGKLANAVADYELAEDWEFRFLAERYSLLRLPLARFGVALGLGVAGLLAALLGGRALRGAGWLLSALCAGYGAAVLLLLYQARYRAIIVPVLAIAAGCLVPFVTSALKGRRFGRVVALALLCCLLAGQSMSWPNPAGRARAFASCLVLEGVLLEQRGDIPGAIASYERSIAMSAHSPRPFAYIGDLLLRQGDAAAALGWYRRGEAVDALSAHEYCNMARALELLGAHEDAVAAARRAAAIDPVGDEPRQLLDALKIGGGAGSGTD
jgi:tetratricopeptide (TPR) repeat protein